MIASRGVAEKARVSGDAARGVAAPFLSPPGGVCRSSCTSGRYLTKAISRHIPPSIPCIGPNGLSTLFEGKSPLRAVIFVGSGCGIALKRRSSRNTRRRTMLLRQDWLEDLSTRGKTQPNGGEFRSKTRRSTLEGLKVAEIGQPRSPLSGDYPWNIVETPIRATSCRAHYLGLYRRTLIEIIQQRIDTPDISNTTWIVRVKSRE